MWSSNGHVVHTVANPPVRRGPTVLAKSIKVLYALRVELLRVSSVFLASFGGLGDQFLLLLLCMQQPKMCCVCSVCVLCVCGFVFCGFPFFGLPVKVRVA